MLADFRVRIYGVTAVLLATPALPAQDDDATIHRVLQTWRHNQSAIKGVRFVVRGERVVPKGAHSSAEIMDPTKPPRQPVRAPSTADDPPQDLMTPYKWVYLLDLAGERFRLETDETDYVTAGKPLLRRRAEVAFDGKYVRGRTLEDTSGQGLTDGSVWEVGGNLRPHAVRDEYWPFLMPFGILRVGTLEIVPGRFKVPLDPALFAVKGRVKDKGRDLLLLRSHPLKLAGTTIDEFWVDEGRDCVVTQVRRYLNDVPVIISSVDYQQTNGAWLPSSWAYTVRFDGRTEVEERMTVEEVALDPTFQDKDFLIDSPPAGAKLNRVRYPGSPDAPAMPTLEKAVVKVKKVSWLDYYYPTTVSGFVTAGLLATLSAGLAVLLTFRRRSR